MATCKGQVCDTEVCRKTRRDTIKRKRKRAKKMYNGVQKKISEIDKGKNGMISDLLKILKKIKRNDDLNRMKQDKDGQYVYKDLFTHLEEAFKIDEKFVMWKILNEDRKFFEKLQLKQNSN